MVQLLHHITIAPTEPLLYVLTEYMFHEGSEGRPFMEYFLFI